MPMVHGRLTHVMLNAADISAWCDNTDLTNEADTHETTTYGKSAKTYAGGLKDGSFSIGGLYDTAVAGPETVIRPLIGTTVTFSVGPEGNATGKVKFTGSAVVQNFNTSHPVGDMVRWTCDLQVSDVITVGAFV